MTQNNFQYDLANTIIMTSSKAKSQRQNRIRKNPRDIHLHRYPSTIWPFLWDLPPLGYLPQTPKRMKS